MQLVGVRLLVLIYTSFFLALAGQVLIDAHATSWWTKDVDPKQSVLIGIGALSGWLPKVVGLLNFLFGFAGGLFVKPVAAERPAAVAFRWALFGLTIALILTSLSALWCVAYSTAAIQKSIEMFVDAADAGSGMKVADVVETLGLLNLTIAAGFLIGLACPGVPGFEKPE